MEVEVEVEAKEGKELKAECEWGQKKYGAYV